MGKLSKWLKNGHDYDTEVKPYDEKFIDSEPVSELSRGEQNKIIRTHLFVGSLIYVIFSVVSVAVFVTMLMITISYLPEVGSSIVPTFNYIAKGYITRSLSETHAINAVTGMILDYRAFDTLGESFVLFSAVTCVLILLNEFKTRDISKPSKFVVSKDPILRSCAGIIVCVVFMFGIYVILNGHISPGGGFSGGALIGAALILYSLAFGDEMAHKLFNIKTFRIITTCALLGYCITKAYSFFVGGMGIHTYDIFSIFHNSKLDFSIMNGGFILILNICVGLVVSCTMYGFYCLFKKGEI